MVNIFIYKIVYILVDFFLPLKLNGQMSRRSSREILFEKAHFVGTIRSIAPDQIDILLGFLHTFMEQIFRGSVAGTTAVRNV